MDELPTRIVAPAFRIERSSMVMRVMVPIRIAGGDLVVSMPEPFSLPTKLLGPPIDSLSDRLAEIVAAFDKLFKG